MARKDYKPLYVEIPKSLWKQFAMICLKKDKSRTEVILEFIEKFVKENE